MKNNSFETEIVQWNIKYPLDKWWRNKHKIAFGSKQHREQSSLDIRLEFEEDLLYKKVDQEKTFKYVPGTGNYLIKRKAEEMSQSEVDDYFDNVDIDNIELNDEGKMVIKK